LPGGTRVLVTGGTGFVGSHVARQLVERGDTVRALARASSKTDNLDELDVEIVRGDLQDPASLKAATQGCELVFHVAADYRLWSRDPRELYRSNVDGTRNILQAALDSGVERVVYTSTVGALGIPPGGQPGTEETPVTLEEMVGDYKRSKFLAEEATKQFARETGLPVVIVNPSTPVGENDIKPTPTGKIIVDFLDRRMPAFVDTGLNLIDVRDVARGHLLAAERGIPGERYILGNENVTLQRILGMLSVITGLPAPSRRIPYGVAYAAAWADTALFGSLLRREPHIPLEGVKMARKHMYFDASRAVKELGLPQSPINDALERAVQWFVTNGYVKEHAALLRFQA
jgi:dihydroflavonol-4-reductase